MGTSLVISGNDSGVLGLGSKVLGKIGFQKAGVHGEG
jgi:hypothetical protein